MIAYHILKIYNIPPFMIAAPIQFFNSDSKHLLYIIIDWKIVCASKICELYQGPILQNFFRVIFVFTVMNKYVIVAKTFP